MVTTSWIPSRYAVRGKTLKLKSEDGFWEDGWEVVSVGATAPSEEVNERSRDYTKQREASDV